MHPCILLRIIAARPYKRYAVTPEHRLLIFKYMYSLHSQSKSQLYMYLICESLIIMISLQFIYKFITDRYGWQYTQRNVNTDQTHFHLDQAAWMRPLIWLVPHWSYISTNKNDLMAYDTSVDPDHPVHQHGLIWVYSCCKHNALCQRAVQTLHFKLVHYM